jgi:hypothetical protein
LLVWNTTAFAADRAVNISIGSDGSGNVSGTIATVRQLIGHAVGTSVVDNFIVQSGSMPVEGGLTACAEAGVSVGNDASPEDPQVSAALLDKFGQFVKQLGSIQPDTGTFLHIEVSDSCASGEEGVCPAGESCVSSGFCTGNESSSGVTCTP